MFIILALNSSLNYEDKLIDMLTKQTVVRLKGCYKGQLEDSYKINLTKEFTLENAVQIAHIFKQETLLYVTNNNKASLIYIPSGYKESLGTFKSLGTNKPA